MTMGPVSIVVMLAALGAFVPALDVESRQLGDDASVERRRASTFQAAGHWEMTEPGPDGAVYETTGAVWVPVKRAKGLSCNGFDVERTASETTVTVYCDPPKGRGKLIASFELETWVQRGEFGEEVDRCRDRHDVRRDTTFTCTVDNPSATS